MELLLALVLAPLLTGVVRCTKARVAGRRGPSLFQAYRDLRKLAAKSAVYSRTTTWIFRAGPVIGLSCVLGALALAPAGPLPPALSFPGDFILLVYLLGAARFATVLAALDTGSSFEGMGASREMAFGVLAELALLIVLASLARASQSVSLGQIYLRLGAGISPGSAGVLLLAAVALLGILLVENARIPFDDPATHLELTMIHEGMVLDHGGPDLAAIELGSMLKLWLFAGILASVIAPVSGPGFSGGLATHLLVVALVGVGVGLAESVMARLPLPRVPQMLLAIVLLALLSLALAPGWLLAP